MSQTPQARYAELVRRASFDARLALDLALALKLPYARVARLQRALAELASETREMSKGTRKRKQ